MVVGQGSHGMPVLGTRAPSGILEAQPLLSASISTGRHVGVLYG